MIDQPPEIRTVPVKSLKAAPYNPRRIDPAAMAGLEKSLERFGVVEPIIVNQRSGFVVGGHQRLKVLRSKKVRDTTIVVVDLDETEEKALNVALNSPHITGEFSDKLESLLAEIKEADAALYDDLRLEMLLSTEGDVLDKINKNNALGSLARRFIVPPFSVFDTKQGYWQDRKRSWIDLGILSDLGRRENLMGYSASASQMGPKRRAKKPKDSRVGFDIGKYEGGDAYPLNSSIFDPVLCEIAYRWFAPYRAKVYDPFAGGSVRGIVAAMLGDSYLGVDLRPEQITANEQQWAEIGAGESPFFPGEKLGTASWIVGDSTKVDLEPESVDFVFSCPPYGSLEVYSDDPADISNMPAQEFIEAYREAVCRAAAALKPNRFACFVVGDYREKDGLLQNFVSETIAAFSRAGLDLYNEAILLTSISSNALRAAKIFNGGRKLCKSHQNVLVFVKGDWKKATEACKGPHLSYGEPEETESQPGLQ